SSQRQGSTRGGRAYRRNRRSNDVLSPDYSAGLGHDRYRSKHQSRRWLGIESRLQIGEQSGGGPADAFDKR
ncbi:MAG TPA: hypothetical protein VIO35_07475, partial [Chloroflexota bacterium]